MTISISKEIPKKPNFSYHRIRERVVIPDGQHMLTLLLEITMEGNLQISEDGAVILL